MPLQSPSTEQPNDSSDPRPSNGYTEIFIPPCLELRTTEAEGIHPSNHPLAIWSRDSHIYQATRSDNEPYRPDHSLTTALEPRSTVYIAGIGTIPAHRWSNVRQHPTGCMCSDCRQHLRESTPRSVPLWYVSSPPIETEQSVLESRLAINDLDGSECGTAQPELTDPQAEPSHPQREEDRRPHAPSTSLADAKVPSTDLQRVSFQSSLAEADLIAPRACRYAHPAAYNELVQSLTDILTQQLTQDQQLEHTEDHATAAQSDATLSHLSLSTRYFRSPSTTPSLCACSTITSLSTLDLEDAVAGPGFLTVQEPPHSLSRNATASNVPARAVRFAAPAALPLPGECVANLQELCSANEILLEGDDSSTSTTSTPASPRTPSTNHVARRWPTHIKSARGRSDHTPRGVVDGPHGHADRLPQQSRRRPKSFTANRPPTPYPHPHTPSPAASHQLGDNNLDDNRLDNNDPDSNNDQPTTPTHHTHPPHPPHPLSLTTPEASPHSRRPHPPTQPPPPPSPPAASLTRRMRHDDYATTLLRSLWRR